MDVNDYIASGIVELYAMGALSPEEKKEFEQRLLLYPEINAELNKAQETLENYVAVIGSNPRPGLRSEILERVKEQQGNKKNSAKVVPRDTSYKITYKYLIAASLAALVISTFASWFFYQSWNDAEDRFVEALRDKNQLAVSYNADKSIFEKTYTDMMVMRDMEAKVTMLMPVDSTQHHQARVYWNKYTGQTYIDVLSLPDPGPGKQYQLWALSSGVPADAGVFSALPEEGMQRLKNVKAADTWAITVEPEGGSSSPTMEQMMMISVNS